MSQREENRSLTALRDEVAALAPWLLNVEITLELSTTEARSPEKRGYEVLTRKDGVGVVFGLKPA